MSEEQFDQLVSSIRAIAHGDVHGPGGLEYLAMVLGESGDGSVAEALRDGLGDIADAIRQHGNGVE